MENILTIDVEEWHHSNLIDAQTGKSQRFENLAEKQTLKILKLLSETNNKATFFIVGAVAEQLPDLVREIRNQGHEIASHGYAHRLVYSMTPEEFAKDLIRSKHIIENVIQDNIYGFRAPSWSVDQSTYWVWNILVENGFRYDSSLFPFKVFLYGSSSHPRFLHPIEVNGKNNILELPPSVIEIWGKRFPFSGGFYFRALPLWFIRYCINRINRKDQQTAILYLHPWEIDPHLPRLPMAKRDYLIQYYHLAKTEDKFKCLLQQFKFISIKQYLMKKTDQFEFNLKSICNGGNEVVSAHFYSSSNFIDTQDR